QPSLHEPAPDARGIASISLRFGLLVELLEPLRRLARGLVGHLGRLFFLWQPRGGLVEPPGYVRDRPEVRRSAPRRVEELLRSAPEQRAAEVPGDRVAPLVQDAEARPQAARRLARAEERDRAGGVRLHVEQRGGDAAPRRLVRR